MRVITAFILAALGAVTVPEVAAQTTARGMYTTLQSREQTTRRALDAGKPERVVRRDVQRIVVNRARQAARQADCVGLSGARLSGDPIGDRQSVPPIHPEERQSTCLVLGRAAKRRDPKLPDYQVSR